MVRQCAAKKCNETDATLLSHRFPKDLEMVAKWKYALKIVKDAAELQKSFVICTKHFAPSAYRNPIANCLNTTAIPNLDKNADNERQLLKYPSQNKQPLLPPRCFKLPPNCETLPKNLTEVKVFRCFKRTKSHEGGPNTKKQVVASVNLLGEKFAMVTSEEPETFEVREYSTEEDKTEVDLIETPVDATRKCLRLVPLLQKVSSLSEVPKSQVRKDIRVHRHSQTDDTPAVKPVDVDKAESRDEKFVQLMYPEYRDTSKKKLIELVIEKNQKIAALEEKVKKMEEAMRKLV